MKGAAPLPDHLSLELRRGAVILAVLSQLREEAYGYSLKKSIADAGLDIDEGTLYPLLRRLESQGCLDSTWRVEDGRPRRYYVLNASGRSALKAMAAEWELLSKAIGRMLK
ncbi:MAG: PadR family transcriptional regulator [Acidimicrobiia bacterium]|nr:PadR family transcriptional regulator [Acidimicrobiia bacterium]